MLACALLACALLGGSVSNYLPKTRQNAVFAEALPEYVRVTNSNTYLYAEPSTSKPMFALPYTYYVKVTGVEGEFYRVEVIPDSANFDKLIGYVLASAVTSATAPAAPLYPAATIKVTTSSARIFLEPLTNSTALLSATNSQSMKYYGRIIVDSVEWYFVAYGDYLGYVASVNMSSPSIANHPTPLKTANIEPDEIPEQPIDEKPPVTDPMTDDGKVDPAEPITEVEQSFDKIQLALILLITIPSIVIVFVLFAPNRNKNATKKEQAQRYMPVATATKPVDNSKPRYFDDYI